MTDSNHLEFIIHICRIYSILLSFSCTLTLIILTFAFAAEPSQSLMRDNMTFEDFSVMHLIAITVLTVLTIITSSIFIVATYTKNPWLSYPYAVNHIILFLYCVISLLGYCVEASYLDLIPVQTTYTNAFSSYTRLFAYNVTKNRGAYVIFSLLLLISLLGVMAFPLYTFIDECHKHGPRVFSIRPVRVGSMVPMDGRSEIHEKRYSKLRRGSKEAKHELARASKASLESN